MKLLIGFIFLFSFQSLAETVTNIDWVKDQINTQQFTSLESFLTSLPETYRSTYALMYDSGSLQQATPTEPRVIEFGEDGSLVLAFNGGNANFYGSNTVELIQFNQAAAKFDFYEISKSNLTGKLTLTEPTAKCIACHRSDARPNWQPYDNWPGAYGSKEDKIQNTPGESANFMMFLETGSKNPRYKTLLNLPETNDPNQFELNSNPNALLGDKLAQWNFMRAARLIRATKDYSAYKYAILGSTFCKFENFFPSNHPLDPQWRNLAMRSEIAALIYIFESRSIDWQNFTMLSKDVPYIDPNHIYTYGEDPFEAGYTYGNDLVANLVQQDPELQAFATVKETSSYREGVTQRRLTLLNSCEELAKLSVEALTKLF